MDSYNPATLALTGGTGALGLAFLQYNFLRSPHLQARLLVRRSSASFQSRSFQDWLNQYADRVTLVDGDMRQLDAGQLKLLTETDGGLWHFAALTSLTSDSPEVAREIHEVNFEGTEKLVEALLANESRGPFYHISTAYVVGERKGIAREEDGAMGQSFRNPYERSKLAAELSVQRAFAEGVTGAIFRPSVVVDDTSGTGGFKMVDACAYAVALAIKRQEPFVFRLTKNSSVNLVHSDWVIAAMSDLAPLPSGSGLTYHLTTPKRTYWRDIAAILEEIVPDLKISFEPGLKRSELPTASKIFDKAISEVRPYFETDIDFDRTNTERDLSPTLKEIPMDLIPFVNERLHSELGKLAHRVFAEKLG
jgi:nucleoside-diphosphate-sugar epimerase